jgi:hypothetical protein
MDRPTCWNSSSNRWGILIMMARLSFQYRHPLAWMRRSGQKELVCGQSYWQYPCAAVHMANCVARISGLGTTTTGHVPEEITEVQNRNSGVCCKHVTSEGFSLTLAGSPCGQHQTRPVRRSSDVLSDISELDQSIAKPPFLWERFGESFC